jgi:hypothetical protein
MADAKPILKPRKSPPTKIDRFREMLTPDQDAGLLAIANRPNPRLSDIQRYLLDLSPEFKVSIDGVSNWYERYKTAGARALALNEKLADYRGFDPIGTIQKLIVDTVEDLDMATMRVKAGQDSIPDEKFLQVLPHLRNSAVKAIDTFIRIGNLQEKEEFEKAGMMRMADGLREIFKGSSFEEALEKAIETILIEAKEG